MLWPVGFKDSRTERVGEISVLSLPKATDRPSEAVLKKRALEKGIEDVGAVR